MATRSTRGVHKGGTHTHAQQTKCTDIPPGLQQTKNSSVHTPGGKKRTFEYPPADGEVLVVMRYKQDMDRRMRNCIIRMKGRIGQPGTEGKCLGITDHVEVLESTQCSDWSQRKDWCIALFLFPSETKARRWYESEKELKQPDFLPPSDGVQLFALKLRYLPQKGKMTFNWMELHNVRSKSYLQQEFVNKAAVLLDDQQVNHGLIFLQDPGSPTQLYRLKEAWIPHNADAYCVVNVFDSKEHFQKVFQQDNYAHLREKRGEVCETVSLLFTIDPNITGAPERA